MTRISLRMAARSLSLVAWGLMMVPAWLAGQEPPQNRASSELVAAIEEARDDFRPITSDDAQSAKQQLASALAELNALLGNGTQENLQAWKTFLRWDELQAELKAEQPNLRTLEEIYINFRGSHPGLDNPRTVKARRALRTYINKAYFAQVENHREQYDAQIETLSEAVARYEENPTPEDAVSIGAIIGWLEQGDQVPDLRRQLRNKFDRPNLYASVSRELIAGGIRRGVNQMNPVHECILGTDVRGTAHVVADIDVNLVPSQQHGLIQLAMQGNMTSNNVGVNGPATIHSTGYSHLHASKLLMLDRDGLSPMRSDAHVTTSTTFDAICANLRLVQRIATKRAYQQKSQAEAIASQRAEVRVEQRFDAESAEQIAEANQRMRNELYRPLIGRDETPDVAKFSTTRDHLYLQMLQVNPSQLAAPGLPPQSGSPGDLNLQLHESLVNNYGEAFLGGLELTDERLVELLEEADAEIPEELRITPDKDPWSITFDYQRPIQVTFGEGTVNIGIRGRQFTRGDSAVNRTIQISADYQIEQGETGARLVRQGDVVVDFPTQQRLGPLDLTAKTFLRNKFEAVFKKEIIGEGIRLEGQWEKAGTLRLSSADVTPGWFVGTWLLEPPAPVATSMASVEK